MNDVELSQIFQNVGRSYGYTNVTAYFTNATDTVRPLDEKGDGITWQVPDVFENASQYIMRDLAFSFYDVFVIGRPLKYSMDVIEYLLSSDFIANARRKYLSRNDAEKYPFMTVQGIPVHFGPKTMFSGFFRVIVWSRYQTISKSSMMDMSHRIQEYSYNLRGMAISDELHADCRHCLPQFRVNCRCASDIAPPFKRNCPQIIRMRNEEMVNPTEKAVI